MTPVDGQGRGFNLAVRREGLLPIGRPAANPLSKRGERNAKENRFD
jgi:hypothetical protein